MKATLDDDAADLEEAKGAQMEDAPNALQRMQEKEKNLFESVTSTEAVMKTKLGTNRAHANMD